MNRYLWIALSIFIVTLSSSPIANGADESPKQEKFRAGAAISNITPPLGTDIIGGFHPFPSTHIHDDLHARCLVLDDGKTKLAIVICDLLGLAHGVSSEARKVIESECKIPASHVLIAGTHTHSAASALGTDRMRWSQELDEYQKFVVRRIADGVHLAMNNLEVAQIGWGVADEPNHVFNRRWFMKPGTIPTNPLGGQDEVKMNPPRASADLIKPAGPIDPQVWVLYVKSTTGRPIALLGNYSLHYVGGVGNGHISADYFAVFADRIQQLLEADRLDPPFVGMMSNATSGDINNNNFRIAAKRMTPYERMREVANDVATAALAATKSIEWHSWVPLGAEYRELEIAPRRPTPEQVERAQKILAQPSSPAKPATLEEIYARRCMSLVEYPDKIPIPLQAFRIGNLGIGTMPCEIFAEIGLDLKKRSPLQPYFTIELAHGYYGYLPTPAQHKLGGYETWLGTSRLELEASDKLAGELLQMLGSLR